ncbi:mycothiol transferase [Actinocorallia populi]|uniref:mycothiol transferase n=1 Tax=Actinocorallia populi TaxID=2079200 RepID=UPI000D0866C7|nr:DinB family protein [Actinocorallia populi]
MTSTDLLIDAFGRVKESVQATVKGLDADALTYRPDEEANSIAWLIWHLTRVQDDHISEIIGAEQIWTSGGWAERFRLPLDLHDTGYGHTPEQVAAVKTDAETLAGYHDAVHAQTEDFVQSVKEPELARIVDENWDPPVTMAVRLVSVIEDGLQHVGQAAYVRGMYERGNA